MQITELRITGLFGRYDHVIPLTPDDASVNRPSVTIIHGPNGVGKSTLLRMLDGMMRLDFDEFRRVPFESGSLTFNSDQVLTVKTTSSTSRSILEVSFDDKVAHLHPEHSGPIDEGHEAEVSGFQEHFREQTAQIHFELIETTRLPELYRQTDAEDPQYELAIGPGGRRARPKRERRELTLSQRVYHFINEAQANYRRFFTAQEPDPWQLIFQRLTHALSSAPSIEQLELRLSDLQSKQNKILSSGLRKQDWSLDWMWQYLTEQKARPEPDRLLPLTVFRALLEVVETRTAQQLLLADRLTTFEQLLSKFFSDKRVLVDEESGFIIETGNGQKLSEYQLSSGEYHLLYLMVRALVARRRGTVIAIDEPELSMHISWQRKLVTALCDCAAGGEPQFIFATHSPDIARAFREGMIRIGGKVS